MLKSKYGYLITIGWLIVIALILWAVFSFGFEIRREETVTLFQIMGG